MQHKNSPFIYFINLILEAPLQLFIPAIILSLIPGFIHGIVSQYIYNPDFESFSQLGILHSIIIIIIESLGLLLFYLFIYPILRSMLLFYGFFWLNNKKIPTLKQYFTAYFTSIKTLTMISFSRYINQIISLTIFLFSLSLFYLFSLYNDNLTNFIDGRNLYVFSFFLLLLSGLPTIINYKNLFFSEILVFHNGRDFKLIILSGKKLSKKTCFQIFLFKSVILVFCFISLLMLAVFEDKPFFLIPNKYNYSILKFLWPIYSIFPNSNLNYIALFVLTYTFYFMIETLFIPYFYIRIQDNSFK